MKNPIKCTNLYTKQITYLQDKKNVTLLFIFSSKTENYFISYTHARTYSTHTQYKWQLSISIYVPAHMCDCVNFTVYRCWTLTLFITHVKIRLHSVLFYMRASQ